MRRPGSRSRLSGRWSRPTASRSRSASSAQLPQSPRCSSTASVSSGEQAASAQAPRSAFRTGCSRTSGAGATPRRPVRRPSVRPFDQRVQVRRRSPPDPVEEGPPAQFGAHGPRLLLPEGRHAYGGVPQHLHEHPAEPDRHGGPEQLVPGDADDHLDTPLDHLAHQDTVQRDVLVARDVGQLPVGVPDLARRGQPDLDQPEFGLVGDPRAGRLHHHRVAHQRGRAHGSRRTGHQLLARHPDAVRPQQLLRRVLAQLLTRAHQCLRLAERRRGGARRRVERRAVAGDETVVVEVGAHGGDAVGDGTEGRHPRRTEQHLAVGRLGAHRRAPHHAHQLVRLLGRVHQVPHEPVAERREGPGDRADQHAHLRVVEDRVDDLPAALVPDRVAAVVHRVGHTQVLGYPLVQFGLPGLRQGRQAQPRLRGQVGEVRARAARDRVDDDTVRARRPGPRQQGGGVLEFVQPVDADHAVLAHRGVHHRVGAGEFAGVRRGRAGAGLGAAHLDRDNGHPAPGGPVGGEQKGAAVLEPLDVAGDGADLGPLGEVGDEVGGLQIGLVAGGRPVGQADAELLEGEDGAALVAGLRDQGDGGAVEVVPEVFEGVQVGVGAQHPHPGPAHGRREPGLLDRPLRARLGEPGGEDHREPRLGLGQFLDDRKRVRDQQYGEVDRLGQICHGRGAGDAEDRRAGGMHRVQPGPDPLGPGEQLPGDTRVGPALGVRGADHGDGLGPEEAVQIGNGGVQRPAADIEVVHLGGPAVDGGPGLLAAGDDPGPAGVGGEGAVG